MPDIAGATGLTITPTSDLIGKRIRIRERGIGPGGTSDWTYSAWSDPVDAAVGPIGELTFMTDAAIAGLSIDTTADTPASRAKAAADAVLSGTATNDVKLTNTRNGAYALAATLWGLRTGDSSYADAAIAYILASPKLPDTTQALNEFRAYHGIFAAVQILKRNGLWNDDAVCPNHSGSTWREFMLTYGGTTFASRVIGSGNGRWQRLDQTAGIDETSFTTKSPSNWGAAAQATHLAWSVLADGMGHADGTAGITKGIALLKQWLGDTTTGLPDFYTSGTYLDSWNNWGTYGDGSHLIPAGVGKFDADDPGLDGVVINDIDRGGTGYNPAVSHWGATATGLTYPLEAADYWWAKTAWLKHNGEDVLTWGEHGDAFVRMNDRLARPSPVSGESQFDYGDAGSSIYHGVRAGAARLSEKSYGAEIDSVAGFDGLPRSTIYWDWLTTSPTWGLAP